MARSLTVDEAMDAIFIEFGAPDIEPDEFTEGQYAERYGMPPQTASRHLRLAIAAGKLTRRRVLVEGRRCWGYRVVE